MSTGRLANLVASMESEIEKLESEIATLETERDHLYYDLEYLRQWMDELGIKTPDRMSVGEELELRQRLEVRS